MRMHNSTIVRKKKPCKRCGKPSYIFSKGRCQQCATIEDTLSRQEEIIDQISGLPELIAELDALVSRYVRKKAQDEKGIIQCYTCMAAFPFGKMDAGHYIPRGAMLLRFDVDRNIRPQCITCNRLHSGRIAEFGKNLEIEMPGVTEILLEESRLIHHWSREELRSMILDYSKRLNQLP